MASAGAKNVASSVEILTTELVADTLEKVADEIFKKYQTTEGEKSEIFNDLYEAISAVVNELRDEEDEDDDDEEGSVDTDGS